MRVRKRVSETVTRGEAARMLGVHKTTVRRYEAEGRLVPTLQPATGVHVFSRRAVQLLAARRRARARTAEAGRELVLSARDVARLAASLGFDAGAVSAAALVAQAERLRAALREARAERSAR